MSAFLKKYLKSFNTTNFTLSKDVDLFSIYIDCKQNNSFYFEIIKNPVKEILLSKNEEPIYGNSCITFTIDPNYENRLYLQLSENIFKKIKLLF